LWIRAFSDFNALVVGLFCLEYDYQSIEVACATPSTWGGCHSFSKETTNNLSYTQVLYLV